MELFVDRITGFYLEIIGEIDKKICLIVITFITPYFRQIFIVVV